MAFPAVAVIVTAGITWIVNDMLDFSSDVMEFIDGEQHQGSSGIDMKAVAVIGLAAAGGFYLASKVVK